MGVNAVSSFVAAPVAVVARPVAVQEATNVNSQSANNVQSDSAVDATNSANNKQDSTNNPNNPNNANATSTTKQPTESQLAKATDELNNFMSSMNTDVKFKLHTGTNELMIQVEDSKTHKILKECPAHELLDAVARMREYVGVLLDKKA